MSTCGGSTSHACSQVPTQPPLGWRNTSSAAAVAHSGRFVLLCRVMSWRTVFAACSILRPAESIVPFTVLFGHFLDAAASEADGFFAGVSCGYSLDQGLMGRSGGGTCKADI